MKTKSELKARYEELKKQLIKVNSEIRHEVYSIMRELPEHKITLTGAYSYIQGDDDWRETQIHGIILTDTGELRFATALVIDDNGNEGPDFSEEAYEIGYLRDEEDYYLDINWHSVLNALVNALDD